MDSRTCCCFASLGIATTESARAVVFVAAAAMASFLWGRSLWYLDERSPAFRRIHFEVMSHSRRQPAELRSLLLSFAYYGIGIGSAIVFLAAYRFDPLAELRIGFGQIAPTCLGTVAIVSVTNLAVELAIRMTRQGRTSQFAALREVPWIHGLEALPSRLVLMAGALGAAVEEFFYRGVVLPIVAGRFGLAPWSAILLAGLLFFLQQVVQLRTMFQAMVIGGGCVAISLVGGLLVLQTSSVIPAMLCHASLVIFFLGMGRKMKPGTGAAAPEVPA